MVAHLLFPGRAPLGRREEKREPTGEEASTANVLSMNPALIFDFDGTITTFDLGELILSEFAAGEWEEYESKYRAGIISYEECARSQFSLVRVERSRLEPFVLARGRPREGFLPLMGLCLQNGCIVEIVSGGIDCYLDLLLSFWNLAFLPRWCGSGVFSCGRLDVSFDFLEGSTLESFKRKRVEKWKEEGKMTIFAGNDFSDREACLAADRVFATGELLKICRVEKIPHTPFENFYPLLDDLKAILATSP